MSGPAIPGPPEGGSGGEGGGGGGLDGLVLTALVVGAALLVGLLVWGVLAGVDCGRHEQRYTTNCGREETTSSSGCTWTDPATTACSSDLFGDNAGFDHCNTLDDVQDNGETWFTVTADSVWPLRNVFDNQSAVDLEGDGVRIRGLHWFAGRSAAPTWIRILGGPRQVPMAIRATYGPAEGGTVDIVLEPDQPTFDSYLIEFPGCPYGGPFMPHVDCPTPTRVYPRSAPQVIGTWIVNQTLYVQFSEPMDPATTALGHGAIDLIFREDGRARSVVSDLDLTTFRWGVAGALFAVTPVTATPFDLVVGPLVHGSAGGALDVDRDGRPDPGRPFVHRVYPTLLQTCQIRADHPAPCISALAPAITPHTYDAPFELEVPIP